MISPRCGIGPVASVVVAFVLRRSGVVRRFPVPQGGDQRGHSTGSLVAHQLQCTRRRRRGPSGPGRAGLSSAARRQPRRSGQAQSQSAHEARAGSGKGSRSAAGSAALRWGQCARASEGRPKPVGDHRPARDQARRRTPAGPPPTGSQPSARRAPRGQRGGWTTSGWITSLGSGLVRIRACAAATRTPLSGSVSRPIRALLAGRAAAPIRPRTSAVCIRILASWSESPGISIADCGRRPVSQPLQRAQSLQASRSVAAFPLFESLRQPSVPFRGQPIGSTRSRGRATKSDRDHHRQRDPRRHVWHLRHSMQTPRFLASFHNLGRRVARADSQNLIAIPKGSCNVFPGDCRVSNISERWHA